MKIELKHLAPYLPHGVEFYNPILVWAGGEPSHEEFGKDVLTLSNAQHIIDKQRQLILRPLSDISKMVEIVKTYDLRFHEGEWCQKIYAEYGETPIAFLPVGDVETWQFKHHFDVFGLIQAGLAIDINTLPSCQQ